MTDREKILGDDVKPRGRHQMMNVCDAAGDRVLDRNHREIRPARGGGGEAVLEGGAGPRLVIGIGLAASDVRVGAGLALEDDRFLFAHRGFPAIGRRACKIARAFSRSAGVSTPSGTPSTIAASMRIPASRAPNCSSRSRCSSGEGLSLTNCSSAARRYAYRPM